MLQFFSLISDSLGSVYKVKELFLMVNKQMSAGFLKHRPIFQK